MSTKRPGDVVSINLSDDTGISLVPPCADVPAGWQERIRAAEMAPNAATGEGDSRFSGL
jgi:uncharacterized protein YbdZ (MbtH family)